MDIGRLTTVLHSSREINVEVRARTGVGANETASRTIEVNAGTSIVNVEFTMVTMNLNERVVESLLQIMIEY